MRPRRNRPPAFLDRPFHGFVLLIVVVLSCSPRLVDSEPLWSHVCQKDHVSYGLPFCNTTLPLSQRIQDYASRIPTAAKIAMMGNTAQGYDVLGIPPYQWWSEGLHGPLEPCVSWQNTTKCPTSFPCPSGLANAFDADLYREIGRAIGIEGRAISELRPHDTSIGDGLTYWSPNVNLQRDPRWGRNQEAPGEDPLLTSIYARNFIQGLQQTNDTTTTDDKNMEHIHVAACCKHFVANSLEHWKGHSRHDFDAQISPEDLHNYYYVPFEECVQAGVAGVMCSYNAVNGAPACTNHDLLQTTLRQSWNFKGYLVTDCGALQDTIDGHGTARDTVDAAAQAIRATVDVNCGDVFKEGLLKAFQQGFVKETAINESFRRLATIQFRLGLFDPDYKDSDPEDALNLVGSHQELALEAAQKSIVMLKNEKGILPLDKDQKFAMIGPHIHGKQVFMSNYFGEICPRNQNSDRYDCVETPFETVSKLSSHRVDGVIGCNVADDTLNMIQEAVEVAKDADRVILVVGLDNSQEREELDRTETVLPGLQQELVRAVLDAAPGKTIVVLVHGGSLSLGQEILAKSSAVLSASYGGLTAAHAMANVLFGKYNPTGKLAATMYPPSYVDEIPLTEMGLNVGVGRTYMYYNGDPEFAFGHGLSYSDWSLDWISDPKEKLAWILDISEPSSITVRVQVTNLGPMPGSQSVLVFWRPCTKIDVSATYNSMHEKLASFQGTSILSVGESKVLTFEISTTIFEFWDPMTETRNAATGSYYIEARAANRIASKLLSLQAIKGTEL